MNRLSRLWIVFVVLVVISACVGTPKSDKSPTFTPKASKTATPTFGVAATFTPPPTMTFTITPDITATLTPTITSTVLHGDWTLFDLPDCPFTLRYPLGSTFETTPPGCNARIDLPFAEGTNLREKWLEVYGRTGETDCRSPKAADYSPGSLDTQVRSLSGQNFLVESGGDAGAGNYWNWTGYSIDQDGFCVSLTFVIHSTNAMNYDPPIPEFDEAAETAVFDQVVETFTWVE